MEKKRSNGAIETLIVLLIAVGVGSFLLDILERTDMNAWLARGAGACAAVAAGFLCRFVFLKLKRANS